MDQNFGERLLMAWASHDPDQVVALCNDDILFEDIPLGVTARGKQALREFVARTFTRVGDLKVESRGSFVHADRGVAESVWSGIDQAILSTGRPMSIRVASVFELRDGKMSRNSDYWDFAAILRQAGKLPTP